MSKWMLAAGAAALAIASPTFAQKGEKSAKGGNKEHAGHVTKAQGGQKGNGAKAQVGAKEHGGQMAQGGQKGGGGEKTHSQQVRADQKADRGGGKDHNKVRTAKNDNRGNDRVKDTRVIDDLGRGRGKSDEVRVARMDRGRDVRVARFDDVDDDFRFAPRWGVNGLHRGFVDSCPPGLARKGNGCLPPGQAKKLVGTLLPASIMSQSLVGPYRQWFRDDDDFIYRWDNDYVYRVRRDGGLIDALFPVADRDFYYYPVGQTYPSYFNYYNVPYQYQSFYPDGGDYSYRYGDGAIYMVDPQTQMISGIAALMAGDLMVGQPLPPTYGAYNVPLSYRSTYYDTPDAWYRYNDGYIYQVDPMTQLITAVISAIV